MRLRRTTAVIPARHTGPAVAHVTRRAIAVLLAAAAIGLAVAVSAGWWAGDAAKPTPPAPAVPLTVTLGSVSFAVDPGWKRLSGDRQASDLPPARTAAFALQPEGSARAIVTLAPTTHSSLIPDGLRARLTSEPPAPAPTRHLGHAAWAYRELPMRDGRLLDVTVVPTTIGVLAIACSATPEDLAAVAGCATAMSALDVGGAVHLRPRASLALRSALPPVVAELNARRVRLRGALRRAETRRGQARIAVRLATTHERAGASLAARAPGAVPARLARVGAAYRRLARAAARGRSRAFRRARRTVLTAERRLGRALAGVR